MDFLQPFLLSVELNRASIESFDDYPFNLPSVSGLDRLNLERPVTFFVGENGAGKSTLLEAIAVKSGLNAEGGNRNFRFATRESHSGLHRHLRLARGIRKASDAFFVRAESLYNVATDADDLEKWGGPTALSGMHERSHGESFLQVITQGFRGQGLYLLDEPEAGLSPSRQMALLVRMHDLVKEGSQFIVATHSPLLMTYPGAVVFLFDEEGIREIDYRETEHYQISQRFLRDPEREVARLLED